MAITWRSVTAPGQGAANAMAAQAASSISDSFDGLKDTFQAPQLKAEADKKLAFEQALQTQEATQRQQGLDDQNFRFGQGALNDTAAATIKDGRDVSAAVVKTASEIEVDNNKSTNNIAEGAEDHKNAIALDDNGVGGYLRNPDGSLLLDADGNKQYDPTAHNDAALYEKGVPQKLAMEAHKLKLETQAKKAKSWNGFNAFDSTWVANAIDIINKPKLSGINSNQELNFRGLLNTAASLGYSEKTLQGLTALMYESNIMGFLNDRDVHLTETDPAVREATIKAFITDNGGLLPERQSWHTDDDGPFRKSTDKQKADGQAMAGFAGSINTGGGTSKKTTKVEAQQAADNARRAMSNDQTAVTANLTSKQKAAVKKQQALNALSPWQIAQKNRQRSPLSFIGGGSKP